MIPNLKDLTENESGEKDYAGYLHNESLLSLTLSRYASNLLPTKNTIQDLNAIHHSFCMLRRENNVTRYCTSFEDINNSWFIRYGSPLLYFPLNLGRDVTKIRQELIVRKIFIPTLWKETVGELTDDEKTLRDNVLLLPCDYRYTPVDIEHISEVVLQVIKDS